MDVNGAAPPTDKPAASAAALTEAAGTVTAAQSPANGGAAPVAPETPYQRRKRVERERAAEAAKRKAEREAKRAAKGAPAQPTKAEAADDDAWDEEQRKRETGGFWRLSLRIVSLVLWPFGYRLDALTDKECAEDVALLAPLAGRHKWLELLIRYAALPYLLVERIATKLRKREPETPPAGKPEAPRK